MKSFVLCSLLGLVAPLLGHAQQAPRERQPLSPPQWNSKLHDGDIVFIRSRSQNAALIAALSRIDADRDDSELADKVFTHCGIVFHDRDGWKVYEGAGRGRVLTLAEWQKEESTRPGNNGRPGKAEPLHNVYVRRWKTPGQMNGKLPTILARAKALHQTRYDFGFSWSDARAYCSELVWKAYFAAGLSFGELPKMSHYMNAVSNEVARTIKGKLEEAKDTYRGGKGYDPNESAVSPEDVFNSPSLVSVTDETP